MKSNPVIESALGEPTANGCFYNFFSCTASCEFCFFCLFFFMFCVLNNENDFYKDAVIVYALI